MEEPTTSENVRMHLIPVSGHKNSAVRQKQKKYLKHRLTCPFVRILFSSADDFFKLEETTTVTLF